MCAVGARLVSATERGSEHHCCHASDEEDHLLEGPSGCRDCAIPGADREPSSKCGRQLGEEGIVDRDERVVQAALLPAHRIDIEDRYPFESRVRVRDAVPQARRSVFPTVILC
jgi:hypothetical protein